MTSTRTPRQLQQQPADERDSAQWRAQQQGGWGSDLAWHGAAAPSRQPPAPGVPRPAGEPTPAPSGPHTGGHPPLKGDPHRDVPATRPNRDREVGDEDSSERESHGRAMQQA